MKKTYKQLLIAAIIIVNVIVAIWAVYELAAGPSSPAEEPLYGAFIKKGDRMTTDSAVDFNIMGYVVTPGELITDDISNKRQVQCLAEDKIFEAEKDGDRLLVYEDGEQIGRFEYAPERFLFYIKEDAFNAEWRGEKFSLEKVAPAVIF